MLNESKFSMSWVRCAFVVRPNFFETAIETLESFQKSLYNYFQFFFQSVTCISLENNVSTARTLRVTDCTCTFYLEICKIPRLFRDYYRDFF